MTPYPYQSPTAGRKDVPAGPGKLWKRIPSERRLMAVEAFWNDEEAIEQQAEALLAIASHLRFRPKTVRTLPADKRVRYLAALPSVSDSVAGRVLVSYHLAHQRPMLSAFLDALGIQHDNGVLGSDDVKPPAEDVLKQAAAKLQEQFPKDDVELYFLTLLAQDPATWGGLADVLEAMRPA
jgi:hypothetical protein